MQPGDGDQVFTGRDTFDFGTSRKDAERMMGMRAPFVVASRDPGGVPFIATEQGVRWLTGAVFAAYWVPPIGRALHRQLRRRQRPPEPGA